MIRFIRKIKNTNIKDYGHIILFLLAVIPALCLKRKRKNLWLVCEYGMEARDNGYWFFKHVREQHPEQDIVYAIDFSAEDYKRVKDLGECVPYGTFRHWVYYLAANVNISSQKGGKPNAAVCYLLEVYGILKNTRVFLQHGIMKDDMDLFHYENTKMRIFICGAKPEYEFIKKVFGYPEGYVCYTGLARFDQLPKEKEETEKMILVVPTWRQWLYKVSSNPYEGSADQPETNEYFDSWTSFLNAAELEQMLEQYGYRLVFFPHRNMTQMFEQVKLKNSRVECLTWKEADVQVLMKQAACLITDYSSVAMDFAYMKKPVIYYQFDEKRFWNEHTQKGYFSYRENGFGAVKTSEVALLNELEYIIKGHCQMEQCYEEKVDNFFELRDNNNSERIYEKIKEIES